MNSLGYQTGREMKDAERCRQAGLMHCQGSGIIRHRQFVRWGRIGIAALIAGFIYGMAEDYVGSTRITVDYYLGVTRPCEWPDALPIFVPFLLLVEGFWFCITAGMEDS